MNIGFIYTCIVYGLCIYMCVCRLLVVLCVCEREYVSCLSTVYKLVKTFLVETE